ncbi:hypothetical protein NDI39_25270 [Microcoleus sp. ZQ-A2]|nr:hypothetical protein [Microcoleus sp. FACHB-1]
MEELWIAESGFSHISESWEAQSVANGIANLYQESQMTIYNCPMSEAFGLE